MTRDRSLTVDCASPQRLDTYLSGAIADVSRTRIQKAIKDGDILVNSVKGKASQMVRLGDLVEVHFAEQPAPSAVPQAIPLHILYEDSSIVVVNKPKGMVTHPAHGAWDHTLVNALLYHCGQLAGDGETLRPGIVQRLDKDTTGVMVVAKTEPAMLSLSKQIAEHEIYKEYVALVQGHFSTTTGTVRAPLARSRHDYKKIVVSASGKSAVTHYMVLKELGPYSLVQLVLETGRTHQIRVHMKHIGHPIVGDPVYGAHKGRLADTGQFLHARRLRFRHPDTNELVEFEAPLPTPFAELVEELQSATREKSESFDHANLTADFKTHV